MSAYTTTDVHEGIIALRRRAGLPISDLVEAVLEAVAPAIDRRAAAKVLREAAERYGSFKRPDSGLIPKEWADGFMEALDGVAKDLRARVDEIEASS